MSKGEWIWLLIIAMFATWVFYQSSKKTRTETFFYDLIEDFGEDELESALL